MPTDPHYYEIDIDEPRHPVRTAVMWIIFSVIVLAIIACAVWVFCFSKRGLNFSPHADRPETQLAAPAAAPQTLPFVGVSLSAATLTLTEGDRTMLTATLKLAAGSPYINVQGLELRWRSSNPTVVSVDRHGDLVARTPGRARISVGVTDRRVDANEAYCLVEVRPSRMLHPAASDPDSISDTQNQ